MKRADLKTGQHVAVKYGSRNREAIVLLADAADFALLGARRDDAWSVFQVEGQTYRMHRTDKREMGRKALVAYVPGKHEHVSSDGVLRVVAVALPQIRHDWSEEQDFRAEAEAEREAQAAEARLRAAAADQRASDVRHACTDLGLSEHAVQANGYTASIPTGVFLALAERLLAAEAALAMHTAPVAL